LFGYPIQNTDLAVLMDGRGFGVRMSTFFHFLIMRCERIQWSSCKHAHRFYSRRRSGYWRVP